MRRTMTEQQLEQIAALRKEITLTALSAGS